MLEIIFFTEYSIFIVDVKSGRFVYQSGRVGDEAKKCKSPAKSGRVGITEFCWFSIILYHSVIGMATSKYLLLYYEK